MGERSRDKVTIITGGTSGIGRGLSDAIDFEATINEFLSTRT